MYVTAKTYTNKKRAFHSTYFNYQIVLDIIIFLIIFSINCEQLTSGHISSDDHVFRTLEFRWGQGGQDANKNLCSGQTVFQHPPVCAGSHRNTYITFDFILVY